MKEKNISKINFVKKIFIKCCRILGYEIIDQSNFSIPTQGKSINENLNIPGVKSITMPLGEVPISRKVDALTVIFRSCSTVNMLSQNKKRLFDHEKSEYTLRSLNSIVAGLNYAKEYFSKIEFNLIIIDHNSTVDVLNKMKIKLSNLNFDANIISLDTNEFKNKIKKINAQKDKVTDRQISNMSNIYKSLLTAKNSAKDLIYFVEDDYIHHKEAIKEMIFAYERISSMLKNELILCPVDYPYLYSKSESTYIFLGSTRHWRKINETLVTFLTSKKIINNYWEKFKSMCEFEHYPFESPLHNIYEKEYCLSPIPSLAMHCTNINSEYGISPNFDWKKIWDENKDH